MSHSTLRAKRASFSFWMDKSSLKMPKIVQFGEFLKTEDCNQTVFSVTRQVNFWKGKNWRKMPKIKLDISSVTCCQTVFPDRSTFKRVKIGEKWQKSNYTFLVTCCQTVLPDRSTFKRVKNAKNQIMHYVYFAVKQCYQKVYK